VSVVTSREGLEHPGMLHLREYLSVSFEVMIHDK